MTDAARHEQRLELDRLRSVFDTLSFASATLVDAVARARDRLDRLDQLVYAVEEAEREHALEDL